MCFMLHAQRFALSLIRCRHHATENAPLLTDSARTHTNHFKNLCSRVFSAVKLVRKTNRSANEWVAHSRVMWARKYYCV